MGYMRTIKIAGGTALVFAVTGLFFSASEAPRDPLGYSYKIELVSLDDVGDRTVHLRLLVQERTSVKGLTYIPAALKKNILDDIEERIFDVKAAMERAKSARLNAGKAKAARKECKKCLSEKQEKKPNVRRFLEGQSWV